MDISKSIDYCLKDTGMMKKKLAERLGVTTATVSTLVKSKRCSPDMLQKLSEVFNMRVSEFIALGESD